MEQVFEADVQVGSVEQQVKGTKTPFVIVLGPGVDKISGAQIEAAEWIDWQKRVGPKALALQGQTASARLKIKLVAKNDNSGYFTNRELVEIAPLGALPPPAQPLPGGVPAQPIAPVIPQPVAAPVAPAPQAPVSPSPAPAAQGDVAAFLAREDAREASRTRQGAVRAASEYVGALAAGGLYKTADEADQALRARINDLTNFVSLGSFNPAGEANVTPEELAASVPNTTVGVPFDPNEEQA